MQTLDSPETRRLARQLRELQAWIHDLNTENEALRRRLEDRERAIDGVRALPPPAR